MRPRMIDFEKVEPKNARFPATEGWTVRDNDVRAVRLRSDFNPGIGQRYTDYILWSEDESLAICVFPSEGQAELAVELLNKQDLVALS